MLAMSARGERNCPKTYVTFDAVVIEHDLARESANLDEGSRPNHRVPLVRTNEIVVRVAKIELLDPRGSVVEFVAPVIRQDLARIGVMKLRGCVGLLALKGPTRR